MPFLPPSETTDDRKNEVTTTLRRIEFDGSVSDDVADVARRGVALADKFPSNSEETVKVCVGQHLASGRAISTRRAALSP